MDGDESHSQRHQQGRRGLGYGAQAHPVGGIGEPTNGGWVEAPRLVILEADLRAWRDGRPVTAGPTTIGYRARKFVGRHRVSVAAAAVAMIAILGGGGVAVWQARVAAVQRDRAEHRFREGEEQPAR